MIFNKKRGRIYVSEILRISMRWCSKLLLVLSHDEISCWNGKEASEEDTEGKSGSILLLFDDNKVNMARKPGKK